MYSRLVYACAAAIAAGACAETAAEPHPAGDAAAQQPDASSAGGSGVSGADSGAATGAGSGGSVAPPLAPICDLSDTVRFGFTSGGGFVGNTYSFTNPDGNMFLFIGGFFLDFIEEMARGANIGGGPLESLARLIKNSTATVELDPTPTVRVLQMFDNVWRWGFRRVLNVIPDVDRYGLTDYVAQGFSIGPGFLLLNLITLIAYVLPWMVAAYYLMQAREIAA